ARRGLIPPSYGQVLTLSTFGAMLMLTVATSKPVPGGHMKSPMTRLAAVTARLWRADGPLTVVGILMIAALAASLAGIWLDPRTITGAPAWVKPAKFAVSIAIYSLTLAWIFSYLPAWPRTRRIVGRTTAAVFVLEWVLI